MIIKAMFWGWLGVHTLSAVTVREVAFGREIPPGYDDPWLEVAIQLEAETDFAAMATTQGDETVTVDFAAAWKPGRGADRDYAFYQAQAALAALPVDEAVIVYFYLPPEIVARDRLRPEPFAWRVQLSVGDRVLPTQLEAISDRLRAPEVARNFAARLAENAPRQAGLLQPIYLTPFWHPGAGKTRDLPTFVRRESQLIGVAR